MLLLLSNDVSCFSIRRRRRSAYEERATRNTALWLALTNHALHTCLTSTERTCGHTPNNCTSSSNECVRPPRIRTHSQNTSHRSLHRLEEHYDNRVTVVNNTVSSLENASVFDTIAVLGNNNNTAACEATAALGTTSAFQDAHTRGTLLLC